MFYIHVRNHELESVMTMLVSDVTLCCWQLWKRMNGVVFRSENATIRNTLAACSGDVDLWKARLPKKDAAVAQSWLRVLNMAM